LLTFGFLGENVLQKFYIHVKARNKFSCRSNFSISIIDLIYKYFSKSLLAIFSHLQDSPAVLGPFFSLSPFVTFNHFMSTSPGVFSSFPYDSPDFFTFNAPFAKSKRPRSVVSPLQSFQALKKRRTKYDEQTFTYQISQRILQGGASIPDIVIMQAHLQKLHLSDIINEIMKAGYMEHGSLDIKYTRLLSLTDNSWPTVIFTFPWNSHEFASTLYRVIRSGNVSKNITWIGVTPSTWNDLNDLPFPLVQDSDGRISRKLGMLDPLGGDVYPLNSIIIFDKNGVETIRLRLGYDSGLYYDFGEGHSLPETLSDVLNYCSE